MKLFVMLTIGLHIAKSNGRFSALVLFDNITQFNILDLSLFLCSLGFQDVTLPRLSYYLMAVRNHRRVQVMTNLENL